MPYTIKTTIIVNAEVEVEFEGTVEELLELRKQLNTLNTLNPRLSLPSLSAENSYRAKKLDLEYQRIELELKKRELARKRAKIEKAKAEKKAKIEKAKAEKKAKKAKKAKDGGLRVLSLDDKLKRFEKRRGKISPAEPAKKSWSWFS
tara:strand:+ start:500 stop:940 length:441 start_codon:yes stop_codon:yes gene_type:complete